MRRSTIELTAPYQPLTGGQKPIRSRKGTRTLLRHRRARTGRVSGTRGLHDLLELYEGINGFNASTLGLLDYKTTYGEVSGAGIKTLSDKFSQYGSLEKFPTGQKTFFDLGSGIGRVVL